MVTVKPKTGPKVVSAPARKARVARKVVAPVKAAVPTKAPAPRKAAVSSKAAKPAVAAKAAEAPNAAKAAEAPNAAKAEQVAKAAKPVKAPKAEKPGRKDKLVRDSFTMPESDFKLIAAVKQRALQFQHAVKKSEVLRAGLVALQGLGEPQLRALLESLPVIKTGRPKKAG